MDPLIEQNRDDASEPFRKALVAAGHLRAMPLDKRQTLDFDEALTALTRATRLNMKYRDEYEQQTRRIVNLCEDIEIFSAQNIRLADIAQSVSRRHKISIKEIKSKRRARNIVIARHECFWLARELTICSFPEIGNFFGGRDHTTVMHGIKMHTSRIRAAQQ